MYNQRRGLASGQQQSDTDTRNTNADLMRGRRRQQLLTQLQEKEDLLKQYMNPRGIGMRGQTVPQRDVDILQQQIDNLRVQLEGGNDALTSAPPGSAHGYSQPSMQASSAASQSSNGFAPSTQFQGGGGYNSSSRHSQQSTIDQSAPQQPAPSAYPSIKAPSTSGQSTRRDEVWHRKYQLWLDRQHRVAEAPGDTPMSSRGGVSNVMPWEQSSPVREQQPVNPSSYGGGSSNQAPIYATHQPPLAPVSDRNTHSATAQSNQLAFAQQQQVQYGRRATPPTQELLNQYQQQPANNGNGRPPTDNFGGVPVQNNNYRRGGPPSSQGLPAPQQQQQQQQPQAPPPVPQGRRAQHHQHTSLW